MEQITVGRIPELLARIVKELEVFDGWLTLQTEPILNGTIGPSDDWIDIYELRRLIPGEPRLTTVRSWMYSQSIPHYHSGGTPMFRRQEIEKWVKRAQRFGIGDFFTKKRKYRDADTETEP